MAVDIKGILEKADDVQPIAESHGKKFVSFDDYVSMATKENVEERMGKKDLGGLSLNPDGSLARTKCNYVAVNLENFYDNRYKKVKNKYYVVIDKMAIDGLDTGRVPYQQITAYLIGEKEGQVECEKKVTISDKEFMADFTHKLNHKSMQTVLDAISRPGGDVGTDNLVF